MLAGNVHGTNRGAFATAGAFFQINISRLLPYLRGEISFFPIKLEELGICQEFDIQVPADLDQFW